MKTFTFKATEDELLALIKHHSLNMVHNSPTPEMSERLHFLTKKLHKDTPDVEEVKQPETFKQEPVSGLAQFEAPKPSSKTTW